MLQPTRDFGKLNQGDTVTAKFELVNESRHPIAITDVVQTCDCTAANLSNSKLNPGERSELRIEWSTGSRRGPTGQVVQVVWIPLVDKALSSLLQMQLHADVVPDIEFSPETLTFDAYTPASQTIQFSPGRLKNARLKAAYSQSPSLEVTLDKESSQVHVFFDAASWNPHCDIKPVIVTTTSPNAETCIVPVTVVESTVDPAK